MSKSNAAEIEWINSLGNQRLRQITYLLLSNSLSHPFLDAKSSYPLFMKNSDDQYSLDFYEHLSGREIDELDKPSERTALGRYAERLLAAWFELNPNYDLLAHNLQLIRNKLTLGEIDFLLWEKVNRKAIHLEFALKYFLEIKENSKLRFIGPKGRDSLGAKAKKLSEQQLPLLKREADLLDGEFQQYDFQSYYMLKGVIFYWAIEQSNADDLWIRKKELDQLPLAQEMHFKILTKRIDWIFPFDHKLEMVDSLNLGELKTQLEDQVDQLPFILLGKQRGSNRVRRIMIVKDSWPLAEK